MTNSQAPVDKLIHAVLIVENLVRHVPSFLKVAGGGQTHPKFFDNQGKKTPSQNLDNPDPLSGGGGGIVPITSISLFIRFLHFNFLNAPKSGVTNFFI